AAHARGDGERARARAAPRGARRAASRDGTNRVRARRNLVGRPAAAGRGGSSRRTGGSASRGTTSPRHLRSQLGRRSVAMTGFAALRRSPIAGLLVLSAGLLALSGSGRAQPPPALIEMGAAEIERLGVEWIRPERAGGRVVLEAPAVAAIPPARET